MKNIEYFHNDNFRIENMAKNLNFYDFLKLCVKNPKIENWVVMKFFNKTFGWTKCFRLKVKEKFPFVKVKLSPFRNHVLLVEFENQN